MVGLVSDNTPLWGRRTLEEARAALAHNYAIGLPPLSPTAEAEFIRSLTDGYGYTPSEWAQHWSRQRLADLISEG